MPSQFQNKHLDLIRNDTWSSLSASKLSLLLSCQVIAQEHTGSLPEVTHDLPSHPSRKLTLPRDPHESFIALPREQRFPLDLSEKPPVSFSKWDWHEQVAGPPLSPPRMADVRSSSMSSQRHRFAFASLSNRFDFELPRFRIDSARFDFDSLRFRIALLSDHFDFESL